MMTLVVKVAMRLGIWGRALRGVVWGCAIFGAAFTAHADWLYWTLDFDDATSEADLENPNFPADNPTGNKEAYVWLMMADYTGDTPTYTLVGEVQQLTGATGEGGHLTSNPPSDEDPPILAYEIASQYDSASYRFFVEIGRESRNPEYQSATWYTLSELRDAGYVKKDLNSLALPWNPTADGWNVPEPSSGLLVLMGGALLALRRRRRI